MAKKPIKETKYCTLLAHSVISDDEYTYAIEKIVVKEKASEEIRFVVYKELASGERLLVRPPDMEEEILIQLMEKAIAEKVLSKKFVDAIKKIVME